MPLDRDRLQGLAGFRRALRRFLAASETLSRSAGVTPQQYQVLLAIRAWERDPMTVKDLAGELLLTHHAAVQLVDRLEAAHLVQRGHETADRRVVTLSLAAAGAELVDALAAQHHAELMSHEPLLSASLQRLKRAGPPGSG